MPRGNILSFITELERIVATSESCNAGKRGLHRPLSQAQTPQERSNLKDFLAYARQHQKNWQDIALQQSLLDEDLPQDLKQHLKNMAGSTTDDDSLQHGEQIELEILSNLIYPRFLLRGVN